MHSNRPGQTATRSSAALKFESAGFFVLRAPLLPISDFLKLMRSNNPTAGTDHLENLSEFLADPLVNCAVSIASPGLSELSTDSSSSSTTGPPAWKTRAHDALFRYVNRMITRPTPFGLFAGVHAGHFTDTTDLQLAGAASGQAVFRPDLAWLEAALRTVDESSDSNPLSCVLASSAVFECGARLNHSRLPDATNANGSTVSIRKSRLTEDVLSWAREPITLAELARLILDRYPASNADQIGAFLRRLSELGFLVRDLTPPPGHEDPCSYAASRLPAGAASAQFRDLGADFRELEHLNLTSISSARLRAIRDKQRSMTPGYEGPTLSADMALGTFGQNLHRNVAQAIAEAITALAAVANPDDYPQHLRAYADVFVDRYGSGAEIPVLEVLDPDAGIDAPTTYVFPPRLAPLPPPIASSASDWRDHLVLSWVQQAIADKSAVTLTDERLALLSRRKPLRLRPAIDVCVRLHAASSAAIDDGDWLAVLAPMGTVPGWRTIGRFVPLLPPEILDEVRESALKEQLLAPDTIFAELSYRPAEARMGNVSGHPALYRHEIPVNTLPTVDFEHTLALSDIVVGVRGGRFYLRSQRIGSRIIVRQSHMLTSYRAPNVCRFLLEVSAQEEGTLPGFHHAIFDRLPFCPRVMRGKVVISPASWNITPSTLSDAVGGKIVPFAEMLAAWRCKWEVPRYLYLTHEDQRLLLDLNDQTCIRELKRAIERLDDDPSGSAHYQKLEEMLPDFDGHWLCDQDGERYASELVIPLVLDIGSARANAPAAIPSASSVAVRSGSSRAVVPGDEWTYLKLQAGRDFHDLLITDFASFAQELSVAMSIDSWFFIRYADPSPQIRVRAHTALPDHRLNALLEMTAWAQRQVRSGVAREFSIETYRPEIERYGGPAGLAHAEQIFYADSLGVSSVLSASAREVMSQDLIVTTAFTLDGFLSALGLSDSDKTELGCLRQQSFKSTPAYRQRRKVLFDLLYSQRHQGENAVARALAERYAVGAGACGEAATALQRLDANGGLLGSWPTIVDSLAHMHVNRMRGVDRAGELEIYALLCSTLRSVLHAARVPMMVGTP